jgi:hypothetical protein
MRRSWLSLALALSALGSRFTPAEAGDGSAELARYDAKIKAEDRQHWAFQPVRRPEVPRVRDAGRVRNPIDAFVLAKLEWRGWRPAPPAEPGALFRRVWFDLIGLPPTPEQVAAFQKDSSAEALDRVVEDLLSRPGYGERWARHWLDLARFAETNGYERDAVKPNAWRYRDYVIRALNADKPFDRFLTEQLAGDELPGADAETMIATGFNRLGPWDDEPADPGQDRFDQLDDIVGTTASVFMGLTLACARCHDHKFEPLTMHDYYRLVAVFDPLRRPRSGRTELDLPAGTREQRRALAERDRRIAELTAHISGLRGQSRADLLAAGRSRLPAEALAALALPPEQRGDAQRKLAEEHRRAFEKELAEALPAATRQAIGGLESAIAKLREATPDLPRGYFLDEPSADPPVTRLLNRGQAASPGPVVQPGLPAVLVTEQPEFPRPGGATTGRRLALARWLTHPDNPLTARVIVNRVWQFHFGEGLVRTPSDFGTMGETPTHPELLDWLADRFVREGWSLKGLHRLILASNTYRMSKRWNPEYGAEDPEGRRLWRVPYRRLEAEAIRDAMLSVSGRLDPTMYGPSVYPEIPRAALESHSDPDTVWKPFDERAASRRTIYAMVKRSLIVPMLEVLDFCDTARSSPKRTVTSVAPQALTLLNGEFVNRQARHLADRLLREVGDDPAKQVERAYLLALSRPPSDRERAALARFIDGETESLAEESRRAGKTPDAPSAREQAMTRACRILFNLNEFVYTD